MRSPGSVNVYVVLSVSPPGTVISPVLDGPVAEDELVVDGVGILDDERHGRSGVERERRRLEPRVAQTNVDRLLAGIAGGGRARDEGQRDDRRSQPSSNKRVNHQID